MRGCDEVILLGATAVVGIACGVAWLFFFFFITSMALLEHFTCHLRRAPLTDGVVPPVDSKQAAAGDGDHGGDGKMREGVCRHVRYRRVGRKLQHHDDVLLHLVLEHEGTLRKETLLRRRERKKKKMAVRGGMEGRSGGRVGGQEKREREGRR